METMDWEALKNLLGEERAQELHSFVARAQRMGWTVRYLEVTVHGIPGGKAWSPFGIIVSRIPVSLEELAAQFPPAETATAV